MKNNRRDFYQKMCVDIKKKKKIAKFLMITFFLIEFFK